jgi:hypothetical protein
MLSAHLCENIKDDLRGDELAHLHEPEDLEAALGARHHFPPQQVA